MANDAPWNLPLTHYRQRLALYQALQRVQVEQHFPEFTPTKATEVLNLLVPLMMAVPQVELTPRERAHLGGATFTHSAALAYRTGRVLVRDDGSPFQGAAPVGASLQFRAQRALSLRGASAILTQLARRLDDLALLDLASATTDATRIHQAVESEAAEAYDGDRALAAAQLRSAGRLLDVRRGPRPQGRKPARTPRRRRAPG